MTTDPFTEAASAAAEEQWPRRITLGHPLPVPSRMDRRIGFTMGAEWARTYLATQEPDDAEVEAAARAISAEQDRRIGLKAGAWWGGAEYRRNFAREDARAALSAARAARRDEKDRP